jgi:CRISPR system Cascade subunit CasB
MSQDQPHPFISYLEGQRENRGVLAALRRGLGQPPGTAIEMYPYVVRYLPQNASRAQEEVYFLVAALFALHPVPGGTGNMGDHFRVAIKQGDETAIERRFTALLAAHPDDLPFYLRQAMNFLGSKEVPINWSQLMSDLFQWGHPERYIQQQWARRFWGSALQTLSEPENNKED